MSNTVIDTRNLPRDIDLERAVLGVLINDCAKIKLVQDCGERLFYNASHWTIFRAMDFLWEHEGQFDQLTLTGHLRDTGELDNAGGEACIAGIAGEIISTMIPDAWLESLRDKAARRKIITVASAHRERCFNGGEDAREIAASMLTHLKGVRSMLGGKETMLSELVREWVLSSDGVFQSSDVHRELDLRTRRDKQNCSKILGRLTEEGIIERVGVKRGQYRKIEGDLERMDWRCAAGEPLDIRWPFGIEDYVELMPGNIAVVAGEPNAGKTAFLLNFIKMNMARHEIHYFSSEMGGAELRKRLEKFDSPPLDRWKFNAWERSRDFADIIRPDAVNVIDYLEIHEDFYRLGGQIKQIFDRLKHGIALIAIQKNRGTDLGRGGIATLEKPRLYLSLAPGECTIVKGKHWASDRSPNGLVNQFKLVKGASFIGNGWEQPKVA